MKNVLKIFSFCFVLSFIFTNFSFAKDCISRDLGRNSICVDIDKGSNSRYTLNSDINCRDNSCAVSCDILLPDNSYTHVGKCDGRFYYDGNYSEKVEIYITINNDFSTIKGYYNFRNGSRGDVDDEGGSSYSNNDLDISASTTSPTVGSYIKLTIDTDDDYVGNISFYKVQYKSSSSSSWTTISSRTNSTYFSNYCDEWEDGYYKMRSSDDGHKVISNFLKFAKKGYYRIYAKDTEGNSDYIDFNVGGSSYSYDLELSTNDKNPSTSDYIDLTVETDDDYVGKVYLTAKYRSSTSSSWTSISNSSSTYFSNRSSSWTNGYISLSSSNNGYKRLSDAFKFAKKGYYRITAEDEDGNVDYIDFNVGSSSYSYDLELSTNDKNPSTSEYVDLTIETDDDYVGKVYLTAKYRSSTSSSWTSISNSSSTYFSNRSSSWTNGYISLSSSNNGYKRLSDAFKFAKKGYYRITAEDEDGNTDYIDFNVGGSSSYSYDLELSTNDKNPSTSDYIDLTVETDDDYVGKVYLTAKYRSSTSSSWTSISNSSSTYFSNRSSSWTNGYISLSSSNNGYKRLSDAFKFTKKGYYRITAEDEDGNTDYIDFNVGGSSSYSYDLELSTNDRYPEAGEYMDLTVNTNSSYRGKVYFSAKYRSSTSNSWTNISITSSTYFINRSTTWNNGYLTMSSSDRGEKTVENIFKFAKRGYYRIIVEDENGDSTYLDFSVGYAEESPLDGFTLKEFETVEKIYTVWPTLISKLRSEYPRIKNSTTWRNMSDELYENMRDVVNERSDREFQNYDDFDLAFRYRFSYTQSLMD